MIHRILASRGRDHPCAVGGEERVHRRCRCIAGDRGAGSVTVVGIVAVVLAVTVMTIPLGAVLAVRQQAASAADAAALAAADVAVGIRPGSPCPAASEAAAANGARVTACVVDGTVVTVRVQATAGILPVAAAATAGPPDAG